ncbi:hypothetical protein JCM11491_006873 [Sporobolomyces phaffii]
MRKPRTNLVGRVAVGAALLAAPSVAASFLSSLQPRNLLFPSASAANSTSALVTTTTTTATPRRARFGHASVYLAPPVNQLVLIGGQLGHDDDDLTIDVTNEVLVLDVASTVLWSDDRPASAIPDNPAPNPAWSLNLDPTAFAAHAVERDRVWSFGGVKLGAPASCEPDEAVVRSFNSSAPTGWTNQDGSSLTRVPPRRRQAQMVPVQNLTTLSTDLWVFGGIADDYSCASSSASGGTVAYVGIDRYSPALGEVESLAWTDPAGAASAGTQPISDAAAEVLQDGTSIVLIGGQTADGLLVALDRILVFNVELRQWYTKPATGDVAPSPRMGHVSVSLESGSIVVHGGLSAEHGLLSDVHLLVPPALSHLSQFSSPDDDDAGAGAAQWEWKTLVISNDSMAAPALAYHAASAVVGGTIVVSFGLDGNLSSTSTSTSTTATDGHASNQLWFLTVDELAGTYTWKDTFEGNEAAVAASASGGSKLTKRLSVEPLGGDEFKAMVKRVEVIANPKAYSTLNLHGGTVASSSPSSSPIAATSPAVQTAAGGNYNDDNEPAATAVPSSSRASSARSAVVATSSSAPAPSTSPLAAAASNAKQNSTTTIGASVGATLGALALLSLAVVTVRRRRRANSGHRHARRAGDPMMATRGDGGSGATTVGRGGGGDRGAAPPLVSSLMYTRPVQKRMLSLGSTISELPGERDDDAADPFSDDYLVNEHGQLAGSSTSHATVGGGGGGANDRLVRSKSSVTSIPFLSTITRDPALASPAFGPPSPSSSNERRTLPPPSPRGGREDVYTSPAPTLSSRRSLRRPSHQLPPMPVPGTPAELIGLAVTSDDGHDPAAARTGVPYRSASASATGWETLPENRPAAPTTTARGDDHVAGIPAALRPATPLRVRNADPFADQ